ncbi:MAG: RNA methyltransferase [Bacteroidales bacterium]
MHIQELSSAQNPKIKELLLLKEKSKIRKEKSLFIVEGKREIDAAINAGYIVKELYFASNIIKAQDITIKTPKLYSLTPSLYSKIAYRESTEGLIAVFHSKTTSFSNIKLSKTPLIIVLESIEKPGNLGAILRTADAVKADAVIICDPLTDLGNPNIIRASLGGVFTNRIVVCSNEEAFDWLCANNIAIFTAQLQNSHYYYNTDMSISLAIVMGTESYGLTSYWRERANSRIKIPMLGKLDSLNVSVSAAILCYEALRQRAVKKTSN